MRKYLFIALLMFHLANVSAQNFSNNSNVQSLAPNDAIEVEGNELAFKMMNVCYQDLLFAFSANAQEPAYLSGSVNGYQFQTIDTAANVSDIKGLVGFLGNVSEICYAGDDTLYCKNFSFSNNSVNLHLYSGLHISEMIRLIGGNTSSMTVLRKVADSTQLVRVILNLANSLEVIDTVNLPVKTFIKSSKNSYYESMVNFAGLDAQGNLHGYILNINSFSIQHHFVIPSFQGEILHIDAVDYKVFMVVKNGNDLSVIDYFQASQTFTSNSLGSFDEIISASSWFPLWGFEADSFLVLVEENQQIKAKVFNTHTGVNTSTKTLLLEGKKVYPSPTFFMGNYNSGVLEYTDSNGRYLARINNNFQIDTNTVYAISQSPDDYNYAFVCFVGIDEKSLPEIKTFLYPNPATNQVNVLVKNVPCDMEHHLELYDLNGKKLYATPFHSKCDLTVPLDNLQAGMYMLQLHINGKVYTRKLMKK